MQVKQFKIKKIIRNIFEDKDDDSCLTYAFNHQDFVHKSKLVGPITFGLFDWCHSNKRMPCMVALGLIQKRAFHSPGKASDCEKISMRKKGISY